MTGLERGRVVDARLPVAVADRERPPVRAEAGERRDAARSSRRADAAARAHVPRLDRRRPRGRRSTSTTRNSRPSGLSCSVDDLAIDPQRRRPRAGRSGSAQQRDLDGVAAAPAVCGVASRRPSALDPGRDGADGVVPGRRARACGRCGPSPCRRARRTSSGAQRRPRAGCRARSGRRSPRRRPGRRRTSGGRAGRVEVDDADRAVLVAERQPPAVGAQRGRVRLGAAGLDRAGRAGACRRGPRRRSRRRARRCRASGRRG